jgi:glycosyltransferase involved in cell wall biosynthesis
MRIIQITPGTGSFYCGTCLRDNAMVVELRRQGHDALMVPLYLPVILDEAPGPPLRGGAPGDTPLFYGGVNVYLQQKSTLFRRSPRWLDRLFDAPNVLRLAASRAGSTEAHELGDLTVSTLRGEEGRQIKELDRLTAWLSEERPEIVCLSNALLVGLARRIKQKTAAPVVCTLQGEDSFLDSLPEGRREEAWRALTERSKDVDAFIAVSHYYGDVMRRRLQLATDRVHVVHNGILLDGYGPAPAAPQPPVLGYLARLCRQKGLATLVEAYLLLRKRNRLPGLRLRIAGSMTASDRPFVEHLRAQLTAAGVADDVQFLPNLSRDEKIAFLQGLSALSVPATYGESFGLYVIEALAAGAPVVQPRHASFPELIEATGGGLLCEPDDPESLAAAVEELLGDAEAARAMGARGAEVVRERFNVTRMAEGTMRVFEQVVSHSGVQAFEPSGISDLDLEQVNT